MAPDPVPTGSEIEIQMALVFDEETFSEPLLVKARVVWCTRLAERHQIGATFVGMTGEQRNYLEMFLRYLSEGRRHERLSRDSNGAPLTATTGDAAGDQDHDDEDADEDNPFG
jgi:hypothetical protein